MRFRSFLQEFGHSYECLPMHYLFSCFYSLKHAVLGTHFSCQLLDGTEREESALGFFKIRSKLVNCIRYTRNFVFGFRVSCGLSVSLVGGRSEIHPLQ